MIISQKNRNGETSVLAVGRISSLVKYTAGNEFKSSKTSFTISYHGEEQADGTIKYNNILCICWSSVADYARRFVKGDLVFIAGRLSKDKTTPNDKYPTPLPIVYCEFVSKQRKGRIPQGGTSGTKGKRNYSTQYEDYYDDGEYSDDIPF